MTVKMAKRSVFFAVAGVLFCIFLAGCAGKKDQPAGEGPVTIDLWYGAAVTEAGPPPPDWKVL
ncbi:MAG: hypothetical protein LBJ24_06900, partial [Treponema sp.]|nr:hypothetical protein [Treponema sp.]